MPALPFLVVSGAVFFGGLYLLMASLASSSADRPKAESSGLLAGLTWATDAIGRAWHKLVRATISHFAESHLVPLVRWFSSLNALAIGAVSAMADAMGATATAVERMTGHVIPREVGRRVAPVAKTAKTATRSAHIANSKVTSTTKDLHRYKTRTNSRVAHVTHAVDVALPRDIAHVNKRVAEVERTLHNPPRDLARRWARRLWAAGLAALLIRTLVRRFPWLFCRTAKDIFRKRGCNMWSGLDRLLGLFSEALLITNICRVLPWLEQGFSLIAAPLIAELTTVAAGLCRPGYSAPELLPQPTLHLPASVDATLHLP